MPELYLFNIEKNNTPFFIYHKKQLESDQNSDFIQCDLGPLNCLIYGITNSNFDTMILKNGYLLQKQKNYFFKEQRYEFSFIEGYYSKKTSAKELTQTKRYFSNHLAKFEEILATSMFDFKCPHTQLSNFEQYLAK
jgi:hypothetical protein